MTDARNGRARNGVPQAFTAGARAQEQPPRGGPDECGHREAAQHNDMMALQLGSERAVPCPARGHAARRSYRWCRPPIWGTAITRPISGDCTSRLAGASFPSDKCVRVS